MRYRGNLGWPAVLACVAFLATAAGGAEDRAPAAAVVQVVAEDGRTCVAEVLHDNADALEILDIKTGAQLTMKRDTIRKIVRNLSEQDAIRWVGLAPYLAWRVKQAEQVNPAGQVVTVTPTAIYMNLGQADGVEVKDRVKVYREGEALTDPKTGEKLGAVRSFLAELEVTEVQPRLSKATRTTRVETDLQRGDIVELVRARKAVAVLPISAANTGDASIAEAIREEWTTILVQRNVPVVERMQLDRVLLELGLQQTGLIDPETSSKVGQLVGAYALLTGSLVDTGPRHGTVHARLLKAATGEVLVAASEPLALGERKPYAAVGEAPQPQTPMPAAQQPLQAASTQEALMKPVTLRPPYPQSYVGAPTDKMSVQYAVIEIAKQAGLKYNWDQSYKNTDPVCRAWITPDIMNVPCRQALDMVLAPRGLTYEIRDDALTLERQQPSQAAAGEGPLMKLVTLRAPYPQSYAGAPTDKLSVQYAVIEIVKQAGLQYNWDQSYKNTDPACRESVRPNILNVPCSQALEMVLAPKGLTYEVRDNEVILKRR